MNKYTFRRFIGSIITIPVALAGYFVVWAVLIGAGAYGTLDAFTSNLPNVSIVWVLAWTFGPDIQRKFDA